MIYMNKLLNAVKNDVSIFKRPDVNFIIGLTASQIKILKKEAVKKEFIKQTKQGFFLTNKGLSYLNDNPLKQWRCKEYPKRPDINPEYLKLEKMPPSVTKAIRVLEKHLINGEDIKEYSVEFCIKKELLSDNSVCNNLKTEMEQYLLQDKKIKLNEFYNHFLTQGLTKSIISVLLLDILSKNKNRIAVYEKNMFQLNLTPLIFDRMIYCPQNFLLQKTEIDDNTLLADISEIVLPARTSNILDITKGLILFIKNLDKYTLQTENLSKKTLRFRNTVISAKDPIRLFIKDIPLILENKQLSECDGCLVNTFKMSVDELKSAYQNLLQEIKTFTFSAFNASSRKNLTKRFETAKDYINEKELKILFNNIIDKTCDDDLWICRIAAFINKSKVPKDWNDFDIADFKVKIKELAMNFSVIESTTGISECHINDNLKFLFEKIQELSTAEKNILLRKIVNG